jgi:hypothetical protein
MLNLFGALAFHHWPTEKCRYVVPASKKLPECCSAAFWLNLNTAYMHTGNGVGLVGVGKITPTGIPRVICHLEKQFQWLCPCFGVASSQSIRLISVVQLSTFIFQVTTENKRQTKNMYMYSHRKIPHICNTTTSMFIFVFITKHIVTVNGSAI